MKPARKKAKKRTESAWLLPYRNGRSRWYIRAKYQKADAEWSAKWLVEQGFATEVGPIVRVEVPL